MTTEAASGVRLRAFRSAAGKLGEGFSSLGIVLLVIAYAIAGVAWLAFLPSVGLLWLMGWLR